MNNHNRNVYNALNSGEYTHMAPHLRHASIQRLYDSMLQAAFSQVQSSSGGRPKVLDLGAGEGTVTLPFLELGADVTAVDISEKQLEQLEAKCSHFKQHLQVRCEDIEIVLNEGPHFDIVVANSLLHHIPDYIHVVERATQVLRRGGGFISFQDPMWRSSISLKDAIVSASAYTFFRVQQGDLLGGTARKVRRAFGYYSDDSIHDSTEYHAVRNGVNQNLIKVLLEQRGFRCEVFEYCSLHSDRLQPWGEKLGIRNTFGVLAISKRDTAALSPESDSKG
ncbi:class I SAM-dependent methyltransferase [Nevskia soli]|uniref:class I SAM-dependent methyltransferase n=1 Tax=Nevskia soli TaxID=418856 RepID=UPI0012F8CB50|nr:class I SAM-dependent methyltransferase [Nevskia soli]